MLVSYAVRYRIIARPVCCCILRALSVTPRDIYRSAKPCLPTQWNDKTEKEEEERQLVLKGEENDERTDGGMGDEWKIA